MPTPWQEYGSTITQNRFARVYGHHYVLYPERTNVIEEYKIQVTLKPVCIFSVFPRVGVSNFSEVEFCAQPMGLGLGLGLLG